ncbi:MAG: hypothetical protein LBL83_13710, partial [Clostridiales bacterium]|nr:hypothetical protein [Clostridiales bacterium]
ALRRCAAEAEAWLGGAGAELEGIDLYGLYESLGIRTFLPTGFGAERRLPVGNIRALRDALLAGIDPIYDFFAWNIIL